MSCDPIGTCKNNHEKARADERAAIVAWLRALKDGSVKLHLGDAARGIERGDHLLPNQAPSVCPCGTRIQRGEPECGVCRKTKPAPSVEVAELRKALFDEQCKVREWQEHHRGCNPAPSAELGTCVDCGTESVRPCDPCAECVFGHTIKLSGPVSPEERERIKRVVPPGAMPSAEPYHWRIMYDTAMEKLAAERQRADEADAGWQRAEVELACEQSRAERLEAALRCPCDGCTCEGSLCADCGKVTPKGFDEQFGSFRMPECQCDCHEAVAPCSPRCRGCNPARMVEPGLCNTCGKRPAVGRCTAHPSSLGDLVCRRCASDTCAIEPISATERTEK